MTTRLRNRLPEIGYPEIGYVRLSELQSTTAPIPPAGIGPERDLHFKPSHSLSADAEAAQQNSDAPKLLDAAQDRR